MSPEPAYSFTIPSISDGLQLDCRIYHPDNLGEILSTNDATRRQICGAVVAHPYAPLGGCYDDAVVLCTVQKLMELGYIVGTLNFRGASGSQGRTSWTGRGEQEDYISFVGFIVFYLDYLFSTTPAPARVKTGRLEVGDSSDGESSPDHSPLRLLLAGYSYGSLVVARLPPIPKIQARFEAVDTGTHAVEVILRARTLGRQSRERANHEISVAHSMQSCDEYASMKGLPGAVSPVTFGGHENPSSAATRKQRRSLEPQRLKDQIRKLPSSTRTSLTSVTSKEAELPAQIDDLPRQRVIQTMYLLISPVLVPFTQKLLTPGYSNVISALMGRSSAGVDDDEMTKSTFLQGPTLVLFGTQDGFTSETRLRGWASKAAAQAANDYLFEWKAIPGAGHFWREEGAMHGLLSWVASWASPSRHIFS